MRVIPRPQILIVLIFTLPWLNPFSPGPTPAAAALVFSWWCAGMALVCLAWFWSSCDRRRIPQAIALSWTLAAIVSAFAGLLQYAGLSDIASPWINVASPGLAYANLRQRNQFATLTNIGLCAVLYGWATMQHTRKMSLAMYVMAFVLGVGNAASSSRTGLTQLLVLAALACLWSATRTVPNAKPQGHRLHVLWIACGAYALASWTLPYLAGLGPHSTGIVARMVEPSPICVSRITLWSNVMHLIGQRPWFGWGWGSLDSAHFLALYPGERFCDILDNAHNLPLHLAVELGLPLAALVCALILWAVVRLQPWKETDRARQMAWAVLLLIGVHSLLEYPLWYGPFQLAALQSSYVLRRISPDQPIGGSRSSPQRAIAALLGCSLVASSGYIGWDYWRVSQLYKASADRADKYRDDTMEKVRSTWLFQDQVLFAELTTSVLTRSNALRINAISKQLLHFSPEPRVVEKLIESAVMLDRDDEALFYLQRYNAAYPQEHARWVEASVGHKAP